MNAITDAAKWLSDFRELHASDLVIIKCASCPQGVEVSATQSKTTPETNPNGVQQQSQHVHFIIKRAVLAKCNITLNRSIEIEANNKLYRVAMDKLDEWEYNDPAEQDVIIKTVYTRDLLGKPQ